MGVTVTSKRLVCMYVKQPLILHLMIWIQFLLISMIFNSSHLRFGIKMKLDLTQMGAGNAFFSLTSGKMFQLYGSDKLVTMKPSGDQYSSFHGKIPS